MRKKILPVVFQAVLTSCCLFVSVWGDDNASGANETVQERPATVSRIKILLEKSQNKLAAEGFFPVYPPYPSQVVINQTDEDISTIIRDLKSASDLLKEQDLSPDPTTLEWAAERKEKLELLLQLATIVSTAVDNMPAVIPRVQSIEVPDSKYSSGIAPQSVLEPETRKKYEDALWENHKNAWNHRLKNGLQGIDEKLYHRLGIYIRSAYLLEPRADEELTALLEEYEYPMKKRVELLLMFKIPYKGFRDWESTDGLFKAYAKPVSVDAKTVTLEKWDGKRTTIKLADLRDVDRKFLADNPPGEEASAQP